MKPLGVAQSGHWKGHHVARVGSVQGLPRLISLDEVRRQLQTWGWARFPRGLAQVPSQHVNRLEELLKGRTPTYASAEISAIEGLKSEVVHLVRSRSRALRDEALKNAKRRCECCGHDFTELEWTGLRAPLHVHHRRQLAASELPRTTRVGDLAVICANCHAMVHSNPKRALAITAVQRHLAALKTRPGRARTR